MSSGFLVMPTIGLMLVVFVVCVRMFVSAVLSTLLLTLALQ